MEENKIVSVSEFSKMANMPKTEIYKLISLPEYAVYISKIAGKKYIDMKQEDMKAVTCAIENYLS